MFDPRPGGTTWSVPDAEVIAHDGVGHPAGRPSVLGRRAERSGPGPAGPTAAAGQPGAGRRIRAARRAVPAAGPLLRPAVLAEPRAAGGADAGRVRRLA